MPPPSVPRERAALEVIRAAAAVPRTTIARRWRPEASRSQCRGESRLRDATASRRSRPPGDSTPIREEGGDAAKRPLIVSAKSRISASFSLRSGRRCRRAESIFLGCRRGGAQMAGDMLFRARSRTCEGGPSSSCRESRGSSRGLSLQEARTILRPPSISRDGPETDGFETILTVLGKEWSTSTRSPPGTP